MPAIIPFLSTVIVAGVTVGELVLFVALSAASYALNKQAADKAKKQARDAYLASLQDRTMVVRSAVSSRRYVVGTVRVGGTLMYAESSGTNRTELDMVVALACNKCDIVGYYIGEDYLSELDFPGQKYGAQNVQYYVEVFTTSGPSPTVTIAWTPTVGPNYFSDFFLVATRREVGSNGATVDTKCTIDSVVGNLITLSGMPTTGPSQVTISYCYYLSSGPLISLFMDGDPDQAGTSWPSVSTPLWTANHRLRGVCYVRTLMRWDKNLFQSGAPVINTVLKGGWIDGHPFYDPRDGSNPNYTDNPAILALWFMKLPRNRGGMGIPASWIPTSYIITAANICDELVTVKKLDGTGYESIKRYQCHSVLDTAKAPVENLEIILTAMAGKRVFTAGEYRIFAGAFRSATKTITDADVIGNKPMTAVTGGGQDAPPNVVTATFADAAKNWTETSPKPVINNDYIASDGHESSLDLRLPATTDSRQANYLQGILLESSRPGFSITCTAGGIGEDTALGDTFQLNLTNRSTYAGRTLEVTDIVDHWNGEFDLTLTEIKSTTYVLDPDSFTPSDPVAQADTSYLWNIQPLNLFTVTPQSPQLLPDLTGVMRIAVTWNPPQLEYVQQGGRIEVRYREASGDWISAAPVDGDARGTVITGTFTDGSLYQFQGRVVSSLGATSDYASAWLTIDGTELAELIQGTLPPSNVTGFAAMQTLDGVLLYWSAVVALNIQYYEVRSGISWEAGTFVGKSMSTLLKVPPVATGNTTWWIKARDQLNRESVSATSVVFSVNAPSQPALTIQVVDNNVLLSWTPAVGTQQILTYEVRRGATWDTATPIGTKTGLFTTVFETAAGTYTYWIAGIDIALNYGVPGSSTATVTAPPDYVLKANLNSTFNGSFSSAKLDQGSVYLPIDISTTYQAHFTNDSWSTPQAQVTAGFPIFIEKSVASGYYEEVYDNGATISNGKIVVTPNYISIGTPVLSCDIGVSADGSSYTTYSDVLSAFATSFRYVKVRLTATSSGGDDIVTMTGLNIKVEAKLKSDAGTASVVSSDSGGTAIFFTLPFTSVVAIDVTANGTTALIPVVNFAGGINPMSFQVLLFNTGGTRVSGSVNWSARGY